MVICRKSKSRSSVCWQVLTVEEYVVIDVVRWSGQAFKVDWMSKQRRLDQHVNVSHKCGKERMRSFVSVNENFPSVVVSFKTRIELMLLFEGDLLSVTDLAWSRDVAVRRNFYAWNR
jgi:hypothetical protein